MMEETAPLPGKRWGFAVCSWEGKREAEQEEASTTLKLSHNTAIACASLNSMGVVGIC